MGHAYGRGGHVGSCSLLTGYNDANERALSFRADVADAGCGGLVSAEGVCAGATGLIGKDGGDWIGFLGSG